MNLSIIAERASNLGSHTHCGVEWLRLGMASKNSHELLYHQMGRVHFQILSEVIDLGLSCVLPILLKSELLHFFDNHIKVSLSELQPWLC